MARGERDARPRGDFGRLVVGAGQDHAAGVYADAVRARDGEAEGRRVRRLAERNSDRLGARVLRAADGVDEYGQDDDLDPEEAQIRAWQADERERRLARQEQRAAEIRTARAAERAERERQAAAARSARAARSSSGGNW